MYYYAFVLNPKKIVDPIDLQTMKNLRLLINRENYFESIGMYLKEKKIILTYYVKIKQPALTYQEYKIDIMIDKAKKACYEIALKKQSNESIEQSEISLLGNITGFFPGMGKTLNKCEDKLSLGFYNQNDLILHLQELLDSPFVE